MEDVILETLMFSKPPEWGRRVVKRGNEILLQTTEDCGKTWTDNPIPEFKLIIPESKTRTLSSNPYVGLVIQDRNVTKRGVQEELKLSPELQQVVESGKLLSIRFCTEDEQSHILKQRNEDTPIPYSNKINTQNPKDQIEALTFLGGMTTFGLASGQVWQDSQHYLRIVP